MIYDMRFQTEIANSIREINTFINENHIEKDMIVNIDELKDGTWILNYFVED